MALIAAERRIEERVHNLERKARAGHARAHREDVGVVVLARSLGREAVAAQRRADALELVGNNGDANAGAADDDTAVTLAALNRARNLGGIVRVVNGFGAVRAKVLVLKTKLVQVRLDLLEELEIPVVTAQSNHVSSFPRCWGQPTGSVGQATSHSTTVNQGIPLQTCAATVMPHMFAAPQSLPQQFSYKCS